MKDEELLILYNQYITPPFLNYLELAQYAKKKWNIDIHQNKLRLILIEKFPNISEIKTNNRKEKLIKNNGYRPITNTKKLNDTQKKIIELASEGKIQNEIADILNITQAYVSQIIIRSGIEITDIKKARTLNKLGDFSLDDMTNLFYELGSVSAVLKWCLSLEMKVNYDDLIYIYDKLLNLKKKCPVCCKEMEISQIGSCSKKCAKERKRDNIRTQQFNRRVKGKGKTTQSVSRTKKIEEANGICYLCKEKLDANNKEKYHPWYVVLDHVEALVHSNDTSKDNLRAVCRCCNSLKNDKPADFYTEEEYKKNRQVKANGYVQKTNNYDVIDKEQFKMDVKNGMTIKELCHKYNRSNFIISKLKNELGVTNLKNKPHAKINPEEVLFEVFKLTEEGKKLKEITEILGISLPSVSKYRKIAYDEGLLERKMEYKSFDHEFILNNVVKLAKEGKTSAETMNILGISLSTVYKYRKEAYQKGILKKD